MDNEIQKQFYSSSELPLLIKLVLMTCSAITSSVYRKQKAGIGALNKLQNLTDRGTDVYII